MSTVNVMVTADDFGVNMPRTEGILIGLREGYISHCSLLVNGYYVVQAVKGFMEVMYKRRIGGGGPLIAVGNSYDKGQASYLTSTSVYMGIENRNAEQYQCDVYSIDTPIIDTNIYNDVSSKLPLSSLYSPYRYLPQCTIGLHLNLTEGPALSQEMRQCPWLCDTITGEMLGKATVIIALSSIHNMPNISGGSVMYSDGCDLRERSIIVAIVAEINAQVREFVGLMEDAVRGYRTSSTVVPNGCDYCNDEEYLELTWNVGNTTEEMLRQKGVTDASGVTVSNRGNKNEDVDDSAEEINKKIKFISENMGCSDEGTVLQSESQTSDLSTQTPVDTDSSLFSDLPRHSVCQTVGVSMTNITDTSNTPKGERNTGIWIDGHHHVHIIPIVLHVLLSLCDRGITYKDKAIAGEFPSTKGSLNSSDNVALSSVYSRVYIRGIRLPQDHTLLLGSSSCDSIAGTNILQYHSEATGIGYSQEGILSHQFTEETDCFGRPFWVKVALLSIIAREKLSLVSLSKISHDTLYVPMVSTDGFIGLDTMGMECQREAALAKICYYQHRFTCGVWGTSDSSSLLVPQGVVNSNEHINNCFCGCNTIEYMTHVGFPVKHDDIEWNDQGIICNNSPQKKPYWFDEFSCSSDREHELGVHRALWKEGIHNSVSNEKENEKCPVMSGVRLVTASEVILLQYQRISNWKAGLLSK